MNPTPRKTVSERRRLRRDPRARFAPDREGRTGLEAIKAAPIYEDKRTKRRKWIVNPNEKKRTAWERMVTAAGEQRMPEGTILATSRISEITHCGDLDRLQFDLSIQAAPIRLIRLDSKRFRLVWR